MVVLQEPLDSRGSVENQDHEAPLDQLVPQDPLDLLDLQAQLGPEETVENLALQVLLDLLVLWVKVERGDLLVHLDLKDPTDQLDQEALLGQEDPPDLLGTLELQVLKER